MPIPQSATDANKWFDRCDCSGNWGSVERFELSVDAVIIGAHSATLPLEVKLLSTPIEVKLLAPALFIAAVEETLSSPSHRVVVTPAGRDALVAISNYATTGDSVEALAKALSYFITSARSDDIFLTPLVRDALAALAKYAAAPISVGYISSAIGRLAQRAPPLFLLLRLSATTSIRDALVTMAPFATTPAAVQFLSSAMRVMMMSLSGSEGFSGTARDYNSQHRRICDTDSD